MRARVLIIIFGLRETGQTMAYLTINETAEKWNMTPRRVQQLCKNGEIAGAVKEGRTWKIPEEALFLPTSGRKRRLSFNSSYHLHGREGTNEIVTFEKREGYSVSPVPGRPEEARRKGGRTPLLPLPVGVSSYINAVANYYYVDKTLLIRDFIDTLPKVSLFTRPRRFGKTLNMDMLRVFFENCDADTSAYFKDKAIWACGERYRAMQGRYPVIYLSFKDVKYGTWKQALQDLGENLAAEFARHSELADSKQCNAVEKAFYKKMLAGKLDEVGLARSLAMLSSMLCRHYGTPAVIIIDEYDTPIQQGYASGYYEDAVRFIRNLFSGAFKDNQSLAFGFMTGILRVAKESIFSGLNNLKVNTIMEERFSRYFGFTKDEVYRLLSYYGKQEKFAEVCHWYDGYRFGNSEIFNPWSVINYVDDGCYPKAFWQSTGSNEIIGEIISVATPDVTENLRKLLQGETVNTYVDTSVIYPEVRRNPYSIYSFLLMAGYLKNAEIVPQNDGNYMCRVSVPNKEIAFVYAKEVMDRLRPIETESTAAVIRQAIYERDIGRLKAGIESYLLQTISYYDTAGEAFYQGMMLGLCAILNDRYLVRSNRESGLGRFEIQLVPFDKMLPGFIFELKAVKGKSDYNGEPDKQGNLVKICGLNEISTQADDRFSKFDFSKASKRKAVDLEKDAATALDQIKNKKYDTEMKNAGIGEIINIGIAFCGKEVFVKSE